MSPCAERKERQMIIFTNVFLEQLIVLEQILLSTHDPTQSNYRSPTACMNIFNRGRADWISYNEEEGKKYYKK